MNFNNLTKLEINKIMEVNTKLSPISLKKYRLDNLKKDIQILKINNEKESYYLQKQNELKQKQIEFKQTQKELIKKQKELNQKQKKIPKKF